jgi:hypothetical protein
LVADHHQAGQYLGLYLEKGDHKDETHFGHRSPGAGSSLNDLDQVFAVLAHLQIARSTCGDDAKRLNTLGYVLRRESQPDLAAHAFYTAFNMIRRIRIS